MRGLCSKSRPDSDDLTARHQYARAAIQCDITDLSQLYAVYTVFSSHSAACTEKTTRALPAKPERSERCTRLLPTPFAFSTISCSLLVYPFFSSIAACSDAWQQCQDHPTQLGALSRRLSEHHAELARRLGIGGSPAIRTSVQGVGLSGLLSTHQGSSPPCLSEGQGS